MQESQSQQVDSGSASDLSAEALLFDKNVAVVVIAAAVARH
jgi:hypothetical protein